MNAKQIITLTDVDFYYTSGYYVTDKWIDNETFIAVRWKDGSVISENLISGNELIKVSLRDMSTEVLAENVTCYGFVTVHNGKVYYTDSDGIVEMDPDTKEKRYVVDMENCRMQMTFGGKYASAFEEDDDSPNKFYRVNIETGEMEKIYEKGFKKPFNVANHLMISPTDKDMFFFAHEGDTVYISNRLWVYDVKTKVARNIAKHRLDENGNVGDCFGHEMWAPDGKGLYFVKFSCSSIKPAGICYVDIISGEYELLYSKYDYWHVGTSRDGRYLTADTQYAPFQSEVVVIDRETGEEFVVDKPYMTAQHPCHPHPQLSPDNSKVMYTALDKEGGRICIKIAYIK